MTDTTDPKCLIGRWGGIEPFFYLTQANRRRFAALKKPQRVMDDRTQPTHDLPMGWGAINRVYPNAIEVGCTVGRSKGFVIIYVFFFVFSAIAFLGASILFIGVSYLALCVFSLITLLSILGAWWLFRIGFWGANDQPFLFLQKQQQVVVLHADKPHFLKVWTAGTTRLAVYPWNTVQARTYRSVGGGSNNIIVRRTMALLFAEAPGSRELRDFADIGIQDNFSDEPLVQIWEYIRRYMEEGSAPVNHACVPNPHAPPCLLPAQYIDAAGGAPLDVDTIDAMLQEQGTSLSPELRKALERSETATSTAAIA